MILNLFKQRGFRSKRMLATSSRGFIHSMEGDIYLLEIESDGVSQFVTEKSGAIKRFRSIAETKSCAAKFKVVEIELAFNTPYDQMIGLASCS